MVPRKPDSPNLKRKETLHQRGTEKMRRRGKSRRLREEFLVNSEGGIPVYHPVWACAEGAFRKGRG